MCFCLQYTCRWFDKSITSTSFANAYAGANIEHSVLDAMVLLLNISFTSKYIVLLYNCNTLTLVSGSSAVSVFASFVTLKFCFIQVWFRFRFQLQWTNTSTDMSSTTTGMWYVIHRDLRDHSHLLVGMNIYFWLPSAKYKNSVVTLCKLDS